MSSGTSAGVSGGDCEGEEQEDSSSSSLPQQLQDLAKDIGDLNVEDDEKKDKEAGNGNAGGGDELSAFREQWQRELESTPTPAPQPAASDDQRPTHNADDLDQFSDEEKAKRLFLRAVEMERAGKLYEAVQDYRRAMQILPDVEMRLYDELCAESPEEESETEEVAAVDEVHPTDDEDGEEGEDLLTRLQRIVARNGILCEPEFDVKGAHISWLPYEVVLLIVRWVVSSELDAAALERVAAVCRGLYVAAREPDIWRSLCVKTWGIDCGTPRASGFSSWRDMYIERPRLQLHGCYISKTTYIRHGENSFQDQFYRPWYLIDYYRYLRFFSEGVALMWTTAEEPAVSVGQLKYRNAKPGLGIMTGHYRLIGDKVVVVLKKTPEKKVAQTSGRFRARRKEVEQNEQSFHMEFDLMNVRSRRNFQLCWRRYSVCTRRDQWTQFELCASKFPPFNFSRVRSYTAESNAPLLCTHAYT